MNPAKELTNYCKCDMQLFVFLLLKYRKKYLYQKKKKKKVPRKCNI